MVQYVGFGIIIDDVVLWTGQTHMATLGGSGVYAVAGMRVWSESVGLVAHIGPDCEPAVLEKLAEMGVDLQGVTHMQAPTPRAWQLFEANGQRTEIPRVPGVAWSEGLRWTAEEVQRLYHAARGWHLGGRRENGVLALAQALHRERGLTISVEPYLSEEAAEDEAEYLGLLEDVAVFSPGYDEVKALLPGVDAREALGRFARLGARVVALRMGAEGSLVHDAESERTWHVPPYPIDVVDHTGAGNAYCGGLLVGLSETGDPLRAAVMGAVAASFMLEQFGPPVLGAEVRQEAERRANVVARGSAPI